ncbi:MAG: ATP-dependent Clp protease ATP-binding subunit, partial [Candidatus Krumholzibacteriota bacterium]|nr:ATP-dependent Clp protease ATP-binding subunit [Candidatus Krumholzibacteriota bacterium]
DKAFDVIDEAGSRARLSVCTIPTEIVDLERSIEELEKEKESAIQSQEFERAASLRDREKELRIKLEGLRLETEENSKEEQAVVDVNDIMQVISDMTGIPVTSVEEAEGQKLLRMEEVVGERIVGQADAIAAIATAVRRNRAGLRDPRRPIGSFLFTGPTGVGKTQLARELARFLFDSDDQLLRIDMSEYMEKFAVSRLIGAPPGYVGYDEGGYLTEKVRRNPYSVVLLDEIEKAHPDVFNILLQILEDGQLTDSFGRAVDFKNTVVIMTSNLGVRELKEHRTMGFSLGQADAMYTDMVNKIMDAVRKAFSPEFLNRIDETIVFHSLGRPEMEKILTILLDELKDRLLDQSFDFELDKAATDLLIDRGFDPSLGARPLRRAIQRNLENPLAEQILSGRLRRGREIRVRVRDGELSFTQNGEDSPPPAKGPAEASPAEKSV